MKKLLLALALLALPSLAHAQCNGVFPNNTVCGNITGSGNLPRPTNPSAFLGAAGGTNGQVQYNNGGALGGLPIVANGFIGSLNGTTEGSIVVPSCSAVGQTLQYTSGVGFNCVSAGSAGANLTFTTRAAAAALNLSAYTVIQTLGYATAGDGGHAVFKNVGSAPFIDSFISTFSIQGGAGCTNGTYGGYPAGSISTTAIIWNKSGNPSLAVGTATVAGNVLTAVNITGSPGNGYSVGDVLTAQNPLTGCSVQPTITVTGVTTPQASFIDTAGNHWQYVPSGFPNILQFGAKGDWNGTDAGATNNFTAVQAASNFAGYKSSTSFDSGGYWGGRVIVPSGSYMMCGSTYHVLPEGTVMSGASASGSSQFHLCDAYSSTIPGFTICDPIWGFACLGSRYENLSFHQNRSIASTGGIFMIYSNNLQDFGGLWNVYVYASQRGCFHFEKGYGGSSWVGAEKVSCNGGSPNNPMVRMGNTVASGMNFGSTIVSLRDLVISGPSSSPYQEQSGIQIFGGHVNTENVHCEIILNECINIDSPAGGNPIQMSFKNINSQGCTSTFTGSGSCAGVITLAGTNDPGNARFEQIIGISAPYLHVISNGQPAGTSYDLPIKGPLICTTTCHTEVIP